APHVGRGGWTWYTGSAGWLYRAGIEAILGVRFEGPELVLAPCIPPAWERYAVTFRYRSSRYAMAVENAPGAGNRILSVTLDGTPLTDATVRIPLVDDGATHRLDIVLGPAG